MSGVLLLVLAASAAVSSPREDGYRANNLGVAQLERVQFAEGAESFRQALKLDPTLDIAQVNLAIALLNVPDAAAAQKEAQAAVERAPKRPQGHYALGLACKALNKTDEAIAAFERVLEIDPDDVGTNINLGQLLLQEQKYAEAVAALRRAAAVEVYNSTAAYSLATALLRSGDKDQGQEQMKRFQVLREAGYATSLSQNYPMQGRYAEALVSTGAEPSLVDAQTPAVKLVDGTETAFPSPTRTPAPKANPLATPKPSPPGTVTLFDYDTDGDLDLLAIAGGRMKMYRNDKGVFTPVTPPSAFAASGSAPRACVAGDYDNDGNADLLVLLEKGLRLYHNEGGGKFSDVSIAAGLPLKPQTSGAAAIVDFDHDGDLDLLIGAGTSATGSGSNVLLRNNGEGKFTDVAAEAHVKGPNAPIVGIVPTDFDNHRDVDLLLVRDADTPVLLQNLRDGSFKDVTGDVGLKLGGRFTAVAAGDLNKDGYTDFAFARGEGPVALALSDGREHFTIASAPDSSAGTRALQALDYDNDGLLDLVLLTAKGLRVVRNLGDRWSDVTATAVAPDLVALATTVQSLGTSGFAAGDLDGDGDTDLVLPTGLGPRVVRNDGGERSASLRVILQAKGSNKSGIGSKVETRAGSLRGRLELYAAQPAPAPADLVFGVGKRTAIDAVRVLWPSGTLQGEVELPSLARPAKAPAAPTAAPSRAIEELDRTPSSCPFLFAWNGEGFSFVTDFMGGGEMGGWQAPAVYNTPDPEEYVRIRGDQLKERNGRYELRVTHELEEVLYVDRLELLVLTHPKDVDVFPNEGLSAEPKAFRLFTSRGAHAPLSAVDEQGHDVLPQLSRVDGRAVDTFALRKIRGYAEPHTLTLDLGPGARRLQLTGWTEYAFSSDNVAASQSGLGPQMPRLEVKTASGKWRTLVDDIGFPVGRPQTIVVDLEGKLQPGEHVVRVSTNLCVYWDRAAVDTSDEIPLPGAERLPVAQAELRWRGFSTAAKTAGRTTLDYDYERVSIAYPWKMMPGRYTREGDVRPLLASSDDQLVIARAGDQLALSFDATRLLPLPAGYTRTFLLHVDGFSKEMNLHSASPDVVAPLPFHGMKRYPYRLDEAPARTEEFFQYIDTYNTRTIGRGLPLLEAVN